MCERLAALLGKKNFWPITGRPFQGLRSGAKAEPEGPRQPLPLSVEKRPTPRAGTNFGPGVGRGGVKGRLEARDPQLEIPENAN